MWDTSHEKYEEQWNTLLETYLHEFCHTIEHEFDYANYHDVISTRNEVHKTTLEVTEEYLLGLAEYEGELVGVPYDYWIGNVDEIIVRYYTVMSLNGENIFWGGIAEREFERYIRHGHARSAVWRNRRYDNGNSLSGVSVCKMVGRRNNGDKTG